MGKLIFYQFILKPAIYCHEQSEKKCQDTSTERWKNGKQNYSTENLLKSFVSKVTSQTCRAQNRYCSICLQVCELLYFILHLTPLLTVLRICWNHLCLWQRPVSFHQKEAVDAAEQMTPVNTESLFPWVWVTVFPLEYGWGWGGSTDFNKCRY